MPTRIGIRDLQARLTATIRRVRNGETFEVTHHGEPVALLTPLPERDDPVDRLVARREAKRGTGLNLSEIRPRPGKTPTAASDALADDRSAR